MLVLAALYLPNLPLAARQVLLALVGAAGGPFILAFATAREHSPAWAGGAALGVVNTFAMSAGAIFQPLTGWLLDLNWEGATLAGVRLYGADSWGTALAVMPACYAVALVAALAARETHCRHSA